MDGSRTQGAIRWPSKYSEIPKEIFQREDVYREELKRIYYGPEWHPIAHASEIANPGDFKVGRVGETQILAIRGDDGEVRAFLNACTHRATQLKTCTRGHGDEVECPYHRWQFNNQGELVGVPHERDFPATFAKENYGLRRVKSVERYGLLFVTFDQGTPPIEEYLSTVDDYIAEVLPEDGELELLGYQKVVFDANWKEYGDQDGYHPPLLHKAFRLLRWRGGGGVRCVTKYGHGAVHAELTEPPKGDLLQDESLIRLESAEAAPSSVVVVLFPGTNIIKHLDVITVRFFFPVSVHQTEVHYAYFCRADDGEAMRAHRLRQASNLLGPSGFISLEDGAVFNRLHRGSTTPGTIEFQKGVGPSPLDPPSFIETNDEHGNLAKWERYREIMGFARG